MTAVAPAVAIADPDVVDSGHVVVDCVVDSALVAEVENSPVVDPVDPGVVDSGLVVVDSGPAVEAENSPVEDPVVDSGLDVVDFVVHSALAVGAENSLVVDPVEVVDQGADAVAAVVADVVVGTAAGSCMMYLEKF